MPTSRVTVHFPCPMERVWQTISKWEQGVSHS